MRGICPLVNRSWMVLFSGTALKKKGVARYTWVAVNIPGGETLACLKLGLQPVIIFMQQFSEVQVDSFFLFVCFFPTQSPKSKG